MPDERYLWDDANLDHIARHNVEDYEAEEALEDPERVVGSAYNSRNERRYSIIGGTLGGRILHIVYTLRQSRNSRKGNEMIRVMTAHDAKKSERKRYKR